MMPPSSQVIASHKVECVLRCTGRVWRIIDPFALRPKPMRPPSHAVLHRRIILALRPVPDGRKPDARPPAWDGGRQCARAVVVLHVPPCVRRATLAGRTRPVPGPPAPPLSPPL